MALSRIELRRNLRLRPPGAAVRELILPVGLVPQRLPSSRLSALLPRHSWVVALPLGPR